MITTLIDYIKRELNIPLSAPRWVQIEITNRCNLDCQMCQRKHFGLEYEDISLEMFEKIIDRLLDTVKTVNLTGWGEPFIHPDIFLMMNYAKQNGLRVGLTSNGYLLDAECRKKIIEVGLDAISFSIENICPDGHNDKGHQFSEQCLLNIKELLELRGGSIVPQVHFNTTIHKNNNILPIIKFAKEYGVDGINLQRLDIRFNRMLERPTRKEERQLCKEVIRLGKELGIRINCPEIENKGLRPSALRDRFCPTLYSNLYINIFGDVTPCCALPRYAVGNILKTPLLEIWNGKRFSIFRKDQRLICGLCDVRKYNYRIC